MRIFTGCLPLPTARAEAPVPAPAAGAPAATTAPAPAARRHQRGCAAFLRHSAAVQSDLVQQAREALRRDPEAFCAGFDATRFSPPSRLALAREAAALVLAALERDGHESDIEQEASPDRRRPPEHGAGARLCRLADGLARFGLDREADRLDVASLLADQAPMAFARRARALRATLALEGPQASIALARRMLEAAPFALAEHMREFGVADPAVRFELARAVGALDPWSLAESVQCFDLADPAVRFGLACQLARDNAEALAHHIGNFAIEEESDRIALANAVLREAPQKFAETVQHFDVAHAGVRAGWALRLGEQDPGLLGCNIRRFAIADGATLAGLYATVHLGLQWKGATRAGFEEQLTLAFFPDEEPGAACVATQFALHPVLAGLRDAARLPDDDHVREIVSTWAGMTSARLSVLELSDAAWRDLAPALEAILKWRAPDVRHQLTHVLANHACHPQDGDLPAFLAFSRQFTRAHTALFPVLLFPLFRDAADDPALPGLVALLHQSGFKDHKLQSAVVDALLALLRAGHLEPGVRRALLAAALPAPDKQAPRTLARTMTMLASLAALSGDDSDVGRRVHAGLGAIRDRTGFEQRIGAVLRDLFALHDTDSDLLAQGFARHAGRSRQPEALLRYAANMQCNLDGQEQRDVMAALARYVRTALLDADGAAFRRARCDPAGSVHLHTIATQAPHAFARWQQPCADLRPAGAAWRAVDTDDMDDLFLCGNEVSGSCQAVHEEAFLSKALLGYVLDGKYRMLAVKGPDERIVGRRMLRLLWDETARRPVLHLDALYENPGLGKDAQAALVELARRKAASMGCVLAAHDKDLVGERHTPCPAPLASLGAAAPFEYVDAEGLHVQPGAAGYRLAKARILFAPDGA